MDTDALLTHARIRFDHESARRVLKEKYQAKMLFAHSEGMFRATPEMICFLDLYGDQQIVVQDLYENPVRVNAQELKDLMQQRWQEQMNAWAIEFDSLSKQR